MTRKPTVTTNPVANRYAAANERIVEFSASNGAGGLISFNDTGERLIVDIYNHSPNVVIRVTAHQAREALERLVDRVEDLDLRTAFKAALAELLEG